MIPSTELRTVAAGPSLDPSAMIAIAAAAEVIASMMNKAFSHLVRIFWG
jgi:hypothetical protein